MKKLILLLVALCGLYTSISAREVIGINDNWRFYFSFENSADYARTISLPHTWTFESNSNFASTQPTTANYIREIYTPSNWAQKRVFIKFYGVENVADIMVNGRYVGEHRGGGTAFTFEITNFIKFGQNNRVQVIVNNAPQSDILPTSTEENRYGGIYRDVELIVTDKSAVSPLYYGSDGVLVQTTKVSERTAEGSVKVWLTSSNGATNCNLSLAIIDQDGNAVYNKSLTKAAIGTAPVDIPFVVTSPKLWSPSETNMYRFVVNVSEGTSTDIVEVQSGFRSIEYAPLGYLKINGTPVRFNGVALYHDYPHTGGAASKRDIEYDMTFIDELGANAIRSMTRPHHPHLYDMCDRSGKLVWIDIPLVKSPFLSDIAYYPTERFHLNGRETLCEIVAQNYNHPSVVMWGIFSLLSSRGDNAVPYIKELNALAKSLDPTRPTVAVSDQNGQMNSVTDLIVWKQTSGWDRGLYSDIDMWSNLIHTRWSNMLSGVMYGQSGRFDQQSDAKGYKDDNLLSAATWNPEGRQRVFHEEYSQRIGADTQFWGVCINSMFDFKSSRNSLGESNTGLITFNRRDRKDIFYLYKAQWNKKERTLHIADKRSNISSEEFYKLTVYASDDTPPTLQISPDSSVVMQQIAPWHFVTDSIQLRPGINKFSVHQGELSDELTVIHEGSIFRP